MATPTPGEAMSVNEAADKSWWGFRHYNPRTATDPRLSYIRGYTRAYRDCLADTAGLSGLQPLLERLVALLEEGAVEREAVRMAMDEQ